MNSVVSWNSKHRAAHPLDNEQRKTMSWCPNSPFHSLLRNIVTELHPRCVTTVVINRLWFAQVQQVDLKESERETERESERRGSRATHRERRHHTRFMTQQHNSTQKSRLIWGRLVVRMTTTMMMELFHFLFKSQILVGKTCYRADLEEDQIKSIRTVLPSTYRVS